MRSLRFIPSVELEGEPKQNSTHFIIIALDQIFNIETIVRSCGLTFEYAFNHWTNFTIKCTIGNHSNQLQNKQRKEVFFSRYLVSLSCTTVMYMVDKITLPSRCQMRTDISEAQQCCLYLTVLLFYPIQPSWSTCQNSHWLTQE